ncbi:MAG: DUF4832 domain-containing protein [Planctomycetota bacterium]
MDCKTRRGSPDRKLSTRRVIDRIMEICGALPDAVKDLPAKLRTRNAWERTFSRKGGRVANILEVMRELPAFTNQAPASKKGWRKVFSKHQGLGQVSQFLREFHATANRKPVRRSPIVYWRDAFGPREVVQRVRPRESSEYIPNPHRGTATFQRFQGEDTYPSFLSSDTHGPVTFPKGGEIRDNVKYIPRTTIAYCRWPWSWFEPKKGRFNWGLMDKALRAARAHGQTLQVRFQPYTAQVASSALKAKRVPPETTVNLPDWYWDTGAAWLGKGAHVLHEPDCNDPRYLRHLGDFIRAFAARYDGHPDLESVDVAYAGFCGETGGNTTPETAARLIGRYLASFRKTPLLTMGPNAHAMKAAEARRRPIGWRMDCFGDQRNKDVPDVPLRLCWNHTMDLYPKRFACAEMKDSWRKGPVTMETCGNVATWVMTGHDLDQIVEMGYKYHTSVFMPKSVFFPERALEKFIAFDRKIGYRFALRQMLLPLEAKPGARVAVEMFIDNVGCAPIYRPYTVALRFKQGNLSRVVRLKEDIRRWLPGHHWFREEFVFARGLERGEVSVALGVVDAASTPRVWFAIDGRTDGGWHPLASMDVD